jgi:hypothetical protein
MTTSNNIENNNKAVGKRPRGRPKSNTSKNASKTISGEFLGLCRKGLSLVQISDTLGIPKETMEKWSRDKVRHKEFSKAFEQGKTAWQAYHETLLQDMISGKSGKKYASAEISAQQFVLKTQFKSEWQEKTDTKIEVNHINQLTDDQLEQQILMLLNKQQIHAHFSNQLEAKDNLKLVVNNDSGTK